MMAQEHLLASIDHGDAEKTLAALEAGADPNRKTDGLTPLMRAGGRGLEEIMRLLIDRGADPYILESQTGASALHITAQGGDVACARLLVAAGAHVNLQAPCHGFTPLMNAVWHRNEGMVAYILSLEDTNVALVSLLGRTARDLIGEIERVSSHTSAARYDVELVQLRSLFDAHETRMAERFAGQRIMAAILDQGVDVSERDAALSRAFADNAARDTRYPITGNGTDGYTPLLAAARDGDAAAVAMLLDAGADIGARCAHMRANAAHKAAYNGHAAVMETLASHPEFPSIQDVKGPYNGYTPLMDAAWHGYTAVARVLIDAGARLDPMGHDGQTARSLALRHGYHDFVDALDKAAASA